MPGCVCRHCLEFVFIHHADDISSEATRDWYIEVTWKIFEMLFDVEKIITSHVRGFPVLVFSVFIFIDIIFISK